MTEDNKISITSCDDFITLGNTEVGNLIEGHYILADDIDCGNREFNTIQTPFAGVLEGDGFTISNLVIPLIETPGSIVSGGIFAEITPLQCDPGAPCAAPLITNIKFNNVTIITNEKYNYAGLIAGQVSGTREQPAIISDISVSNLEIKGGGFRTFFGDFGGLVGSAKHTEFLNISLGPIMLNVEDLNNRGGIAGFAADSVFSNISAHGVTLGGYNYTNHYDINRGGSGGLVGTAQSTDFSNVDLALTTTIRKGIYTGGLIGKAEGVSTIRSIKINAILATDGVCRYEDYCAQGGLIGLVAEEGEEPNTTVISIYETTVKGKIQGQFNTGGLIGKISFSSEVMIKDAYTDVYLQKATSNEDRYAGGLIGRALEEGPGTQAPVIFTRVFALGKIELMGEDYGRGIIGHKKEKGSTRVSGESSYFDNSSAGTNKANAGDPISEAKNYDQMRDSTTFSGWEDIDNNQGEHMWTFPENSTPVLTFEL